MCRACQEFCGRESYYTTQTGTLELNIRRQRGGSHENALAETVIGLYNTELIEGEAPWRNPEQDEYRTFHLTSLSRDTMLNKTFRLSPPDSYEQSQEKPGRFRQFLASRMGFILCTSYPCKWVIVAWTLIPPNPFFSFFVFTDVSSAHAVTVSFDFCRFSQSKLPQRQNLGTVTNCAVQQPLKPTAVAVYPQGVKLSNHSHHSGDMIMPNFLN